jgi:hypothetical protein
MGSQAAPQTCLEDGPGCQNVQLATDQTLSFVGGGLDGSVANPITRVEAAVNAMEVHRRMVGQK